MNGIKYFFIYLTLAATPLAGGELNNGFQYETDTQKSENIDIRLELNVGQFNEKENESGIARFLACALLQETENFDIEDVSLFYRETGQDLLARTHVKNTPSQTIFHFSVPKQEDLDAAMALISDAMEHATLSPLAIEIARSELLETVEDCEDELLNQVIERIRLTIETYTPQQLKERYAEWYRPDLMTLTVTGPVDQAIVAKMVQKHFSALLASEKPTPYHCSIALHEAYTTPGVNRESLNPQSSDDTVVVQGKIFMKTPSFVSTRTFGVAMGALLVFAGLSIGIVLLCFPGTMPVSAGIAAGLISILIGSGTMLFPNYYNDPAVIEEKRIEDKQYGFKYAYAHGRAHLTLTPFERRNLFIRENSTNANRMPQKFSDFCITDLADLYDIGDHVFQDMLYPHEAGELKRIQEDFYIRRSNVTLSKKLLEKELNALVSSHQTIRDMSLDNARNEYETSLPVVKWREIKAEWEHVVDGIWADFDNAIIDEKTREEYLHERNEYYEAWLNSPQLVHDVNVAKQRLEDAQKLAVATYEASVKQCKLLINYDERMEEIEHGKWALYSYFNQVMIDTVSNMVPGDPNFIDFIDLR